MKSLFNIRDTDEIISRINKLTPESKPEWGKMNVTQMLAHTTEALRVPIGELILKRGLLGKLMGGFAKKGAVGEKPFGRGLPTDKNLIKTDTKSFEEEKAKLVEVVKKFQNCDREALAKREHSFFGNMTTEEWDVLMWKHLDHHLKQFGA